MRNFFYLLTLGLILTACTPEYNETSAHESNLYIDRINGELFSKYAGDGQAFVAANPNAMLRLAEQGEGAYLKILVEAGADPDFIAPGEGPSLPGYAAEGYSPLGYAIANGHFATARTLVDLGADPALSHQFYQGFSRWSNSRSDGVANQNLAEMAMSYKLGDRNFYVLSEPNSSKGWTRPKMTNGVLSSPSINVGPYGALLYADMYGYTDVVNKLLELGVGPLPLSNTQTDALERVADVRAAQIQRQRTSQQNSAMMGNLFVTGVLAAGAGFMASEGFGEQAVELMAAGVQDVWLGGGGSALNALNSKYQNMSLQNNVTNTGGASATPVAQPQQSASQTATISFQCPSGVSHSQTVEFKSSSCRAAAEKFAKVMACNMIDDMDSAQRAYYSACADEIYE